jgi:hypothetical protein
MIGFASAIDIIFGDVIEIKFLFFQDSNWDFNLGLMLAEYFKQD